MAFDPEMDKILKKWQCEETDCLFPSINMVLRRAETSDVNCRIFKKKEGQESQRKAGRLTIEDVMWFLVQYY